MRELPRFRRCSFLPRSKGFSREKILGWPAKLAGFLGGGACYAKGPVIIYRLGGVGGFWAKHDEI